MGKATVISHDGDGQYTIEMSYDLESLNERISDCDDRIAALETKITEAEDAGEGSKAKILRLYKAAAEKEKNRLQSVVDNYSGDERQAWCADLTTNLSGEVGTIEPGHDYENGVNIYPGYSDASYNASRDGQVAPLIGQSPAASFFNLATLPGTQKWRPNYRYGTITEIDCSAHTCGITLDAVASRMQSLDCNQASTLSDVPIEYMNCNSAAFAVGDGVIVKFEGFAWDSPKVIGFKSEPKACTPILAFISCSEGIIGWDLVSDQLDTMLGLSWPQSSFYYINAALDSFNIETVSLSSTGSLPLDDLGNTPYEYTTIELPNSAYEQDEEWSGGNTYSEIGESESVYATHYLWFECSTEYEEVGPKETYVSANVMCPLSPKYVKFDNQATKKWMYMKREYTASADQVGVQCGYIEDTDISISRTEQVKHKTLFGSLTNFISEVSESFEDEALLPGTYRVGHVFESGNFHRHVKAAETSYGVNAGIAGEQGNALVFEFTFVDMKALADGSDVEKDFHFKMYADVEVPGNDEDGYDYDINSMAELDMDGIFDAFGGRSLVLENMTDSGFSVWLTRKKS